MAKQDIEIRKDREKRKASRVLMHFYMIFLAISLVVIGKILYIQYIWEPNPKFVKDFKPAKQKEIIEPERGTIIDHNGRLLAISTPLYNIYMDCYVMKEVHDNDKEKGAEKEAEWVAKAKALAKELRQSYSPTSYLSLFENIL